MKLHDKTVLIVEPSKHIAQGIRGCLNDMGVTKIYVVPKVSSLKDFTEVTGVAPRYIDLVLLAHEDTPDKDIQTVQEIFLEAAIIILGHGEQEGVGQSISAGCHSYLVKPFTFGNLEEHIRFALKARKKGKKSQVCRQAEEIIFSSKNP